MNYLCEREIGFDATEIGFPSVMGCRAIVLVTAGGLFGYHLNGTLNAQKLTAFINFVNTHPKGRGRPRRRLYVACSGVGMPQDYQEIGQIAAKLCDAMPIYWATLPVGYSSFVHFQNIGNNTCTITSRLWDDRTDSAAGNKVNYANANRTMDRGAAPRQMYENVSLTGLVARYPNKISA
ncbi:hypothetical protein ABE276_002382 [Salmonella enterica]